MVGSIAAALVGLRLIGLSPRWALAALLWTPFFQGLYVGNVAVPAFALFAAAPWFGAGLILAAVFKPYSGLAALWLVRERRLRALVVGLAVLALLVLLTLPLVGIDAWRAWIEGLDLYSGPSRVCPPSYRWVSGRGWRFLSSFWSAWPRSAGPGWRAGGRAWPGSGLPP